LKSENSESGKKQTNLLCKITWGVIGIFCIFNLYVFFYHFLNIATPGLFSLFRKNDFVGFIIFGIIVVSVNLVFHNLAGKSIVLFFVFNLMILAINFLAFRSIWFGL
jgi:hypothetical protein